MHPSSSSSSSSKLIYKHISSYAHPSWYPSIPIFLSTVGAHYFLHFYPTQPPWPLLPLAALFRIKLFIICHDCAHNSFFPSKQLNTLVAFLFFPVSGYTPYSAWNTTHNYHHRYANNLDKEDTSWTLTSYSRKSKTERFLYKFFWSPYLFLSGLTPLLFFCFFHQLKSNNPLEIILEGSLAFYFSSSRKWKFELASFIVSATIGMLLFNIQHTFEGVVRKRSKDWSPLENGLKGCSLLVLPRWFKFFTLGLEYHHIHHLSTKVPGYLLQRCHEEGEALFGDVKRVMWWEMVTVVKYILYDEDKTRLATVKDADKILIERRNTRDVANLF